MIKRKDTLILFLFIFCFWIPACAGMTTGMFLPTVILGQGAGDETWRFKS